MFSQFFVQIFALYKFFRKNLRKKRRKFSMDPICQCDSADVHFFILFLHLGIPCATVEKTSETYGMIYDSGSHFFWAKGKS